MGMLLIFSLSSSSSSSMSNHHLLRHLSLATASPGHSILPPSPSSISLPLPTFFSLLHVLSFSLSLVSHSKTIGFWLPSINSDKDKWDDTCRQR